MGIVCSHQCSLVLLGPGGGAVPSCWDHEETPSLSDMADSTGDIVLIKTTRYWSSNIPCFILSSIDR